MYKRMIALGCIFLFSFSILYMRIFWIVSNPTYQAAGQAQGTYTLTAGHTFGNIYDRSYNLLVNDTSTYYAVINPTSEAAEEILPYVKDLESYHSSLVYGKPFVCEVTKKDFECGDITVFEVPVRNRENQLAQHVIGYLSDGEGVSGIEAAYNDYLRSCVSENTVTYSVDGRGSVMDGLGRDISENGPMTEGVVLTIDKYIQAICELAGSREKGSRSCNGYLLRGNSGYGELSDIQRRYLVRGGKR